MKENVEQSHSPVSGVSSSVPVALIQIQRELSLAELPFLQKAFTGLAAAGAPASFVSQTASGQTLCVAVPASGLESCRQSVARELAKEIESGDVTIVTTAPEYCILSVTGAQMRHRPGTAGRVFQTLGHNGVNIVAIAQDSSERDISFVVRLIDREKACQALEEAFALTSRKHIHLFLCGVGQVGSKLLEQIHQQQSRFREQNLEIRLTGIANSKHMYLNRDGTPLDGWKAHLKSSTERSTPRAFFEAIRRLNLSNSIFVDCTANDDVPKLYEEILSSSISVITPNKRGNAAPYEQYMRLRDASRRSNVKFFYETNVGAGLPIIGTLNDLLVSGDEIIRIEAVLSGTLSYIFNTFRPGLAFSTVVREAKAKGYTEPDPRDDLSGKDFARKLLILAREMGIPMREEEVEVESLIPKGCESAATPEEFLKQLEGHDAEFEKLAAAAAGSGKVIRYIGRVEGRRAAVSMQTVDALHPFYSLSGSDNIVSFTTKRYFDRPLVVKGPGAGVEVTAAGVLADIIRAASYLQ